ncbi:MAG: M20/M25/M40 family metallo-hydrolase [Gemmatirosa sp.]
MPASPPFSLRVRALLPFALLLAAGCASATTGGSPSASTTAVGAGDRVTADDVRELVSVLAADSMEGRATGRRGSLKAARFIAERFARYGVKAAGDSGYVQRVPMVATVGRGGRQGAALAPSFAALDTVPAERRLQGGNVLAIIEGSDPVLRDSAILVGAHYDHLGIGAAVDGDSIFNGADDDASGTAAVMLVARALASGPRPKRTVVFGAFTGEETGLVGTRWYIRHPAVPLTRTVADFEIEMIGRPDSLAGGAGRAWLTGYERSTMGERLAAAGIPLVADPRPAQNFFQRSDNIAFAYLGIPAHTISTFNLHGDYHTVNDEADRLDYAHMARVVESTIRAVRLLADGAAPEWKPGQKPVAPAGMRERLGLPAVP